MDHEKPIKAIHEVREAEAEAQVIIESARKRKEKAISDANEKARKIIDDATGEANALSEEILKKLEGELAALKKRKLEEAKRNADKTRKSKVGRSRLEKLAAQAAKEIVGV